MINSQPILAIETSDKICSVCVYFSSSKYFEAKIELVHSHSEKLFTLIDFVMKQASLELKDISPIAISSGPGSFTGLRIGMAAAKGISKALSIPIVPVPTFEALALQLSEYLSEGTQFSIANKVNKDEVYFAQFQIKDRSFIFTHELKILPSTILADFKEELIFGNAEISSSANKKNVCTPDALYIAKWCEVFGEKFMSLDIDNLEPNYIRNFLVKRN
ncbi:MAG TPA: tRNA (adenosine(37)-N6)-threonylcarbamoyltransferase complex dimerization subunit type 1 TsaB [Ignavibacteriaceae bacterium]|nr:tRNA (adenosine(37)-N6)-threonylcarbamoyltransferase complex dimerization subunit type 1 TsaB [Ignavibacteriaceae bacterium]